MNITVFGATGGTGRHIVEQALERGHTVTAFVRTPAKLTLDHPNLHCVQGDVTQPDRVAAAIEGADAVLSALAPVENKPTYAISQGMQHILNAMEQHHVDRLIVTAGAGIRDPKDKPGLFDHVMGFLLNVISKHVVADMERVVEQVRGSDTQWTILRAPMLTDDDPQGQFTITYVGSDMGTRLTRADFATAMLDQLTSEEWVGKAPAVSN